MKKYRIIKKWSDIKAVLTGKAEHLGGYVYVRALLTKRGSYRLLRKWYT